MIQVVRETHACPAEIQERLTRAGGVNEFGEPNFRLVWGWSRLSWIGGWWTTRDASGNEIGQRFEMRLEPRYLPPWDRWILEAYRPATWFGSRWLWEMQTTEFAYRASALNGFHEHGPSLASCGPYPSRGDYIHVTTVDIACRNCWVKAAEQGLTDQEKARILGGCMEREFLQITPRVANTLAGLVRRSRDANYWQVKREIQAQRLLEEKISKEIDERQTAQAQETSLTKRQLERIERVTEPAIERQLAWTQRLLKELNPAQKQMLLNRTGRGLGFNPRDN